MDPTEAEAWTAKIEEIFRYMGCPEAQQVPCAVFVLRDDALLWWRSAERSINVSSSPVTWLQFKEALSISHK
ncbi:MAG: hypothetical protein Q8835_02470 [Sweet potato little leaf phytoplasma]|nr:hypothetical protein [Sweet potato little leaf phytoplasma]